MYLKIYLNNNFKIKDYKHFLENSSKNHGLVYDSKKEDDWVHTIYINGAQTKNPDK